MTTKEYPVAVEKFGRDHWSLLLYIETRCVDHNGVPRREHMRCSPKRNPGQAHDGTERHKKLSPTRLKGGELLYNRDDWDCADDLEAAGYVQQIGTGANPRFAMTEVGWAVAGRLRRWRAESKPIDDFTP